MADSVPRVNGALMGKYVGSTVRMVGKVLSVNQNEAVLSTADEQKVTIKTQQPEAFNSMFVEVVGKLNPDNTIEEFQSISFGNDFDLNLYNSMLTLSNGKHADLFL